MFITQYHKRRSVCFHKLKTIQPFWGHISQKIGSTCDPDVLKDHPDLTWESSIALLFLPISKQVVPE